MMIAFDQTSKSAKKRFDIKTRPKMVLGIKYFLSFDQNELYNPYIVIQLTWLLTVTKMILTSLCNKKKEVRKKITRE